MGIPSYFSYIVKNHSKIIRRFNKNTLQVNNLYLDANSIVYDCIHKIDFTKLKESDMDTINKGVFQKIDEYISLLQPDNNLFIAFDGTAPIAKLEQQRQRRYKSNYQNKISKHIYKTTNDPWNTSSITPGTKFMSHLSSMLRQYYNNPSKYNLKNIILSPSDRYGEGEHKLFDYIRSFPEQHLNFNTVIYGLDADLIMLSINHLPVNPNIYLFRETPEFIKSLNSELEPNETYVLDIPELATVITQSMNMGETNNQNRIYDYIFMCFFLGNDFMPHFPSINIRTGGIDKMLNAYKATIGNTNDVLTNGKTIYWKNVRKLVQFLANNEEEYLKTETSLRNKREHYRMAEETNDDKLKKFEATPVFEREREKYIDPFKTNWQRRYYKALFDIEPDETIKKQIAVNYLEGLEWTMKYYTTGCADWRWRYNYNYPPLLCDLMHYIPYFETEFIKNKGPDPINELVQLCYVLPKESLYLLPANIGDKVNVKFNHYYKTDCEFVWAYCRYFWESHVMLPEIDIAELEAYITSLLPTRECNN